MILAKALIAGYKVRRDSWPTGIYVESSDQSRLGTSPITVVDIDSVDLEPPGARRYLTLRRDDPKARTYAHRDIAPGIYIPKSDVAHFEIQNWQPSIDDLFATDWVTL